MNKIPKSICYCLDEKNCKKIKQILNEKLDTCAEIISDREETLDRILYGFKNGQIQVICLTKGKLLIN